MLLLRSSTSVCCLCTYLLWKIDVKCKPGAYGHTTLRGPHQKDFSLSLGCLHGGDGSMVHLDVGVLILNRATQIGVPDEAWEVLTADGQVGWLWIHEISVDLEPQHSV